MASRSKKTKRPSNPLVELTSLLVFGAGVFTLVSILSYDPEDPSLFSNTAGVASNLCGMVGAFVSAFFLQSLGMGAFLMPAALFFVSVTIHQKESMVRVTATLAGMTIAVMALSVFLTLQWKYWPFGGTLLLTGGAFGAWVTELLLQPLNPVGTSIVSLLLFLSVLVLSTPVSLTRLATRASLYLAFLSWHLGKVLVSHAIYYFGLLTVKGSRAFADVSKVMVDEAGVRLKQISSDIRARRMLEYQPADQVIEKVEGVPVLKSDPLLGIEDHVDSEDSEDSDDPDWEEGDESFDLKEEEQPKLFRAPEILPAEKQEPTRIKSTRPKPTSGHWKLPTLNFLSRPPKKDSNVDKQVLIQYSQILAQKLKDFGIEGEVTAVRPGPVITLFEFKPGPGIKVSRIAALADDLSMALSAESVRILAPLPGKAVVGIEIPSENREMVFVREFLEHSEFFGERYSIPIVMGKDIGGAPQLSDLARMPHLLCAGQTGSGKSVFMNSLICSLLYRFTPDELRLVLVDPKFIEFRAYQDLPHLLLPVVDDPKDASTALKWAVREMERRYRILAMMGVRNLASYNSKVEEMGDEVVYDLLMAEENNGSVRTRSTGGDWVQAFEMDEDGSPRVGKLPTVVVIIDELADLMMIAKKEVEVSIARIAQKARAAGIHLVIATQRPSTDVITGLIKANLPSRVSFQLASFVDSKTILDRGGAERLLGQGDMLFVPPGSSQLVRLHGPFVDDDEINKITAFLRSQGEPVYRDEILVDEESEAEAGDEQLDEKFEEAIELVRTSGHASASFLQRHLKIGYNRAARMIETMEGRGIVGPAEGSRPREVLR